MKLSRYITIAVTLFILISYSHAETIPATVVPNSSAPAGFKQIAGRYVFTSWCSKLCVCVCAYYPANPAKITSSPLFKEVWDTYYRTNGTTYQCGMACLFPSGIDNPFPDSYTCPSEGGWQLSGAECVRPDCQNGQIRSSDGTCQCAEGLTLIDGECRSPCGNRKGETANLCIAYGADANAVSVGGCAAYPSSITDQCSTGLTCGAWTLDGNQAPANPAYSEVVTSPTCCAAGACWSASQQMCLPCTGEASDVNNVTETTKEITAHGWIHRTLNRKYGSDVEDKVTFRFLTPKSNTSVSWPTIKTDPITFCLDNNNPAYCQNKSPTIVPNCTKTGSECLEGDETRVVNGESIHRDCWKYRDSYQCILPDMENDCQELRDKGCTQTGSTCAEEHNGSCILYEQNYRCERTPGQTSTTTQCGSQTFCLSGNCTNFNHVATPGEEFSRSVALMEAQREAGSYLNQSSLKMFNGVDNRCSKKLGGLGNCCKKNTQGGQSNSVVAQALTSNALNNAGGYLINSSKWVGSTYAYDSLFSSDAPEWMVQGFESMFGSGLSWGQFNPSLSFMGLGVTFGGAVPVGATALPSLSSSSASVYWNPASFYWSIGLMVLQEILSCDQDEQVLAMKRGSNLCHQVGSYCSSKFFGVCLETKESYCCYNSRLARIINEQGRVQLNRGWGDPKGPDCSGLTTDELNRLDFSTMDLSEFYAEIAPNSPDAEGVKSRAGGLDLSPLRDRVPDYFSR